MLCPGSAKALWATKGHLRQGQGHSSDEGDGRKVARPTHRPSSQKPPQAEREGLCDRQETSSPKGPEQVATTWRSLGLGTEAPVSSTLGTLGTLPGPRVLTMGPWLNKSSLLKRLLWELHLVSINKKICLALFSKECLINSWQYCWITTCMSVFKCKTRSRTLSMLRKE